jgi:tetratricopeptide (TPR) repeat protein/transcriptional regulator with XRE-family HTH domain
MQRPKNHIGGIKYPNRIGHCIKKYGYTFTEVADEIGIGRRTLSYYIAGERAAPRYCLEKIARLLGCEVEELTDSSMLALGSDQGKRTIARTKPIDISYIVGRDAVTNKLLAYLHPVSAAPRIKVCVLYALPGTGKTTVLRLLRKRLAEDSRNSTILYEFARDMTPAEHLDVFLAQMNIELGIPLPESTKLPPLQERISQVINEVVISQTPLIFVLDDAQVMLEQDGNLATVWKQFLQSFIEVDHQATLYMATREWPGWTDRERVFFAELELEPLSADAAVQLWHHLGFTDVPTDLLLEATRRCGSNPQMIEIRAKGLQGHYIYGWQDESLSQASQKSEHRLLIEKLLSEDYVFDTRWDIEARKVLEQVISKRLSYQATQVLDLLSASPVPLPFSFLERLYPSTKQVFEELLRCSLVDRDSLFTERVNILPFAREAHLYTLNSTNRLEEAERQVIGIYAEWLNSRELRADEKSKVIAEFAVLLLKHERLLEAAENLIRYGWMVFNAGYGARLARLAKNIMQRCDWLATADNKCGAIVLQYVLLPFSGVSIDDERRAVDYQMIYDLVLTGEVKLEPVTEAHIVHHLAVSLMRQSKFQDAESLLNTCCARITSANPSQIDVDLQASLMEKQGWLLATWSEYEEEQGDTQRAKALREQAIAVYRRCYTLLSVPGVQTPLKESVIKKRIARCYNNIAYHLNRLGLFEEALLNVDQSLALKEQGYVQLGSLAASYGEKSIALAGLGRFQQALYYDEKAYADLERHIRAGHTHLQPDKWMYQVNRGRLYLTLGNIDEAEKLLREALLNVPLRRNMYKMRANEAIHEIEQWRQAAKTPHYQLDWRWVERYRELVSFDAYWWLNPAGPFTQEERHQWDQLFTKKLTTKRQLGALIAQSRDRELEAAITEQREPNLQYPAIDIEDVRTRIMNLHQLDEDIAHGEKNAVVRRLYHETIEEELWFLRLIEACYEGNIEHFWGYNVRLNPPPTKEEMQYTLSCVGSMLYQGLHRAETREVSEQLIQLIQKNLHISLDI